MIEESKQNFSLAAEKRKVSVAEGIAQLPNAGGEPFSVVLEHGSLSVEIYAPRGADLQKPHTRDEAYVVIRGKGEFINGEARQPFKEGDFIFVPAGVEHRFVNFTGELMVWVIFYGPEGGEGAEKA